MLSASLRFATPILLAALGELYTERSGILNLGLEGVMLVGAFAGFLTMHFSDSMWLSFLAAVLTGLITGLLLGFFYVTLRANQVIVGILFSLMMVGFTSYAYRLVFGTDTLERQRLLEPLAIPLLSRIPVLGQALFHHSPFTYLALLLVPVAHFVLYRTGFGLQLRAVGEHPRGADTLGIDVTRTRYAGTIIGCVAASAGGAFFALSFGAFLDTMLSGRGYIALAIVIFGRWQPVRALVGAILFGFVDALALRLQALAIPVPHHFLLMLPYLLTIAALLFSVGSRGDVGGPSGPDSLMVPYERE
jgi:simple sugar transport system permease protein